MITYNICKFAAMNGFRFALILHFEYLLNNIYTFVDRWLHIYKKEDGEWKVYLDIWNYSQPME